MEPGSAAQRLSGLDWQDNEWGAVQRGDEPDKARLVLERDAMVVEHLDPGSRALQVIPGVLRTSEERSMVTAAQREAIAAHLTYELHMLWASAARLGQTNQALNNCVLESFALHARNIIDFFYTAPQKDDVVAAHFFAKPEEWAARCPPIAPVLDRTKRRANKEVSHLTYTRCTVDPEDKPWPTADIIRALDCVLAVFCEHADLVPDPVRILKYRELLP